MHLPLDDHGIDDVAAVVDGHEAADLDLARPSVEVHHADVAPERVGEVRRIVVGDRLEARLHARGVIRVRGQRDLLDRLRSARRALHGKLPRLQTRSSSAASRRCAAIFRALSRTFFAATAAAAPATGVERLAVRPEAVGGGVRVPLLHLDVGGRDPQLLGEDLSVRGLVSLPLGDKNGVRGHGACAHAPARAVRTHL